MTTAVNFPEICSPRLSMGLYCMPAPEEYGGPGLDTLTCAILTEELSKGDAGFATTVAVNPIATFQAIQFMLADMAIQVEAARWLVYRAAFFLKDAGKPFTLEAAMAKTLGGDVAMKVSTDAVQIFGGHGYSR